MMMHVAVPTKLFLSLTFGWSAGHVAQSPHFRHIEFCERLWEHGYTIITTNTSPSIHS